MEKEYRIIYQLNDQPMSVVIPVMNDPLGYSDPLLLGEDIVPTKVPFWVVEPSYLPSDRTFRNAWKLDLSVMGEPSGFGK